MCGIVATTDARDQARISTMLARIVHRGPDDGGVFVDEPSGVALGMRRLSILDLAGGRQPMSNEDGSVWIVFNGEIYNSPELREELERKGHVFRTRNSDTEVLVHLYEQHGPEMVQRLNGMFAFVIFDKRRRQLFGARDRIGIKPLYYAWKDGRFALASELKCLCLLPWVSREIDFDSFYHYLSLQFVPAPGSILRDVRKLPAGCFFTYDLDTRYLAARRWWQLAIRPDTKCRREEFVERLRAALVTAVKRRRLSDVPIACSLSGGLDSSAVVGALARSGGETVRTYSLGFVGRRLERYNELPLARLVARQWGTEHHEVVVEADQLLADLQRMAWHLDEPYGGGLPSWYVYQQIASDCKVALTGTGGDELFGNYEKWRVHERPQLRNWIRTIRRALQWGSWQMMEDFRRYPQGHLYHRYFADAVKNAILIPEDRVPPSLPTEGLIQQLWDSAGVHNARDAVASVDFQLQLPEEFLLVTDRFAMAHSVEARVPFLDHELVELAFTVPAQLRTRRGDPKYLEKLVIAPLVPAPLLTAPKRGFVFPLREWTRGELRGMIGDMLGPETLRRQGLLSPRAWQQIIKPHLDGRQNFTSQVWTLLMFQLWYGQLQNALAPPAEAAVRPAKTAASKAA